MCDDVTHATPIPRLLTGKHLIIAELVWPPFAEFNSSKQGNAAWSGYDIDIIALMASRMDFTYEIRLINLGAGETWTQLGFVEAPLTHDIVASWWYQSAERALHNGVQLKPFVDVDSLLVVLKPKPELPEFSEQMFTFLEPFAKDLWFLILCLIATTAVCIVLIEHNSKRSTDYDEYPGYSPLAVAQKVLHSIYMAFAQFTDVGGYEPKTKGGRGIVLLLGFTFVVLLSAYTANLASILTVSRAPTLTIGSIGDLISRELALCVNSDMFGRVLRDYPTLRLVKLGDAFYGGDDGVVALRAGTCAAVMLTANEYETYKKSPDFCDIMVVGQPIVRGYGSWVTNKESWCVEAAVNYALMLLEGTGELDVLHKRYFLSAPCGGHSNCESSSGVSAGTCTSDLQLHIDDMAGLFLIYTCILVAMVLCRMYRNYRSNQWLKEEAFTECQVCGNIFRVDSDFCRKCGAKRDSASEAAACADTGSDVKLDVYKEVIAKYFTRYDLDSSGTINSASELQMLTLNAISALNARGKAYEVRSTPEEIDNILDAATLSDSGWGMAQYTSWFRSHFEKVT